MAEKGSEGMGARDSTPRSEPGEHPASPAETKVYVEQFGDM
jgi:hypothetical protein